ncbi:MAG: hypothetical protein JWQ25_685 [Daejeonella sp.]|nr:hypothetical protein [Daejeonella sp.]
MLEIGFEYYFFGSEDSIDIDVLVVHKKATGTETDKALIKDIKSLNPKASDWNINIIDIENGYITKSIPSKGSVDSVNNSLFRTYNLHNQKYSFPIKAAMARNFALAAVKCIRAILTSFKKTSYDSFYKEQIRNTLKFGDFNEWIHILKQIDFNMPFYDVHIKNLNSYKSLAFRIGQTISLSKGIEIYTKKELKASHPTLIPIINRETVVVGDILQTKVLELYAILCTLPIRILEKNVIEFEGVIVDIAKEQSIL